jgi:hypothetical protein
MSDTCFLTSIRSVIAGSEQLKRDTGSWRETGQQGALTIPGTRTMTVQLPSTDVEPWWRSLPILHAVCRAAAFRFANRWPTDDQWHDHHIG